MRKSKYKEEQIAYALKQVEYGSSVEEVCRKDITAQTFYRWKKKCAGMLPSDVKKLNSLKKRMQN